MNMLMNKRCLFAIIFAFFVSACAHGPVYTAKNEGEAIKKGIRIEDCRIFIVRIKTFILNYKSIRHNFMTGYYFTHT